MLGDLEDVSPKTMENILTFTRYTGTGTIYWKNKSGLLKHGINPMMGNK